MLESEYKITLDVHEVNAQHILFCKQGDTARRIIATLTEESELYPIAADCTAVFSALKPDGKILFNEAQIVENTIVYDFTEQTANVSGKLDCELRLYGYGNDLITSPRFSLLVHPAVYADIVESKDEVNVLTGLISEATELMDNVNNKLDNGDFVPKLSVGTVTTLPAGSVATVEITGTGEKPVLNFGIPQGPQGQAESLIPDAELSAASTKPVQNRVIAAALAEKADKAETQSALSAKANAAETAAALDGKVDKVSGKGLSSNDFTDAEKQKLAGIAQNANNYSLPDGGVTTAKLADAAVTAEKLAAGARTLGKTVVLTAAGWADQTQTLAVAGVTAENHLVVSAAPGSREVYNDAEIYCSAQADGSLTFACGSVPGEDVTVHVLILV